MKSSRNLKFREAVQFIGVSEKYLAQQNCRYCKLSTRKAPFWIAAMYLKLKQKVKQCDIQIIF